MELVANLLLLYGGILLINVVVTGVLWYRHRTRLNQALFYVWTASVVVSLPLGVLDQGPLTITFGFSSAFLVNLALAYVLGGVVDLGISWRAYATLLAGGLGLSTLISQLSAPFWAVALPTCLAVATPLLHTTARAVIYRRDRLTPIGWVLTAFCLLYVAHNIDFAFMRPHPSLTTAGFTIAILISFGLSTSAPAVVLERVARERTEIEQLAELRRQFFDNISHEIRTPLTLILAPLDELLGQTEAGPMRSQLEIMKRNGIRLLQLIDELLDLSRIDAGGLRLTIAQVDLATLVRSTVERYQPLAERKSIRLLIDCPENVPEIYGDLHRLEMIVANLLGNALKYTPEGGRVWVRVHDDGGSWAELEVEDNGPGVPREDLNHIFERFYRSNDRKLRRPGGTGIGLSLAKELVDLHGGRLHVQSQVGHGTRFELKLRRGSRHFPPEVVERRRAFHPPSVRGPAIDDPDYPDLAVPTSPIEAEPATGGSQARVLVVEDQPEMRGYICRLLERHYQVLEAVDGEEGLRRVREERPDLVVSDVSMPGRDGNELCREIKQDPKLRATPVILLTARLGSEATLTAYAHGANDFVAKPFHPNVLLARIRAQLDLRSMSLQVIALEKLAAVGTLSAGIVHEIRNPINAIANAARVVGERDLDSERQRSLIDVIREGAGRIERIVGALESHARPAEGQEIGHWTPQEGLDSTLQLLQHRLGDVEVHRRYRAHSEALVRPGPINQVFLNLVDNSLRAGATEIWLETGEARDALVITVSDDGPGVPVNLRDQIFEPFVSNRSGGEGMGLGLFLSRRIVEENGGSLELLASSDRGPGACFEVRLPKSTAAAVAT